MNDCCAPTPTAEEIDRINRWQRGEEIAGFPPHATEPFKGYNDNEQRAVITQQDLREYRAKNRRLASEKLND